MVTRYSGATRRAVALPLGGLGAGHVAIAADGSLRQWQLANTINHQGFVPDSFFALRVSGVEPPFDVRRTLRGAPLPPSVDPAPLVTDHLDPWEADPPTSTWPPVPDTTMSVAYPFATVELEDPALPVTVSLDAWTPFVPLDAEASGLPLAAFTFRIANRLPQQVHGWLVATLQNAVGWDGVTAIDGGRCALYGGNQNRAISLGPGDPGSAVLMTNDTIGATDPRHGQMLLASDRPAVVIERATSGRSVLGFVEALRLLGPTITGDWSPEAIAREARSYRPPFVMPEGPSPAGATWVGALAIPFALAAGAETTIEVVHAWWFPERVAGFDQFGPGIPLPETPPRLGNRYATRFDGAASVVIAHRAQRPRAVELSRAWADSLIDLDAPDPVAATLAAQPSLVRSPTTFLDAEGRLLGFEGALGASTLNWNGSVGGSCPLNCSHVWNYEQAIAALFPDLERTMRDLDWDVLQDRDGAIAHRLRVPIDGPQLHGQAIGGPLEPALDGMLGAVLKTYREARNGGGRELLVQRWPSMRRLMDHVEARWDPRNEGILRGPQPMTYDIALTEPNTFIGSLWIAALRAMARVARILGRDPEATRYAGMADTSTRAYDEALWNGRYYGRAFDEDTSGLGAGCLADQLNGQWWAHQLELGHVLPTDHVRTALRTILACNLRHGFRDFEHGFRVFADGDESGLLICTWPDGGRPEPPVRYADEVWTGVEYAVASLCLFEGLQDEAMVLLEAVRARYDGSRRNPYNEIECGDHYSRAMAGWSVLQAWTGSSADVIEGTIRLGRREGRAPLLAGTAWARTTVGQRLARVEVVDGAFELRRLACDAMPSDGSARATLRIDERPVSVDQSWDISGVAPERPVSLVAGAVVELAW